MAEQQVEEPGMSRTVKLLLDWKTSPRFLPPAPEAVEPGLLAKGVGISVPHTLQIAPLFVWLCFLTRRHAKPGWCKHEHSPLQEIAFLNYTFFLFFFF